VPQVVQGYLGTGTAFTAQFSKNEKIAQNLAFPMSKAAYFSKVSLSFLII
jgi:hypothetical protein